MCPICSKNQQEVARLVRRDLRSGKGPSQEMKDFRKQAMAHWRACTGAVQGA